MVKISSRGTDWWCLVSSRVTQNLSLELLIFGEQSTQRTQSCIVLQNRNHVLLHLRFICRNLWRRLRFPVNLPTTPPLEYSIRKNGKHNPPIAGDNEILACFAALPASATPAPSHNSLQARVDMNLFLVEQRIA